MRLVYCNDHLLSLFGCLRAEVLGRPFHLMLHEEERERPSTSTCAASTASRQMPGQSGTLGRTARRGG